MFSALLILFSTMAKDRRGVVDRVEQYVLEGSPSLVLSTRYSPEINTLVVPRWQPPRSGKE